MEVRREVPTAALGTPPPRADGSTSCGLMLLLALLPAIAVGDESFFLKPPPGKLAGPEIALVIVQGASSPTAGYRSVAEAIQNATELPVWVGVPQFLLDEPSPIQLSSKIRDSLHSMTAHGMAANRTLLLAHSLGGVFAQQHVMGGGSPKVDALALYGSTILRKYRNNDNVSTPILTLDGTLDGLLRVTRQAEAWWHQVGKVKSDTEAAPGRPVVLLDGLNHWSISSGAPPPNVVKHDLPAEVAAADAHAQIASVLAAFAGMHLDQSATRRATAASHVRQFVKATAPIVSPLIESLEMEGSRRLRVPCDSDYPTNPKCGYPKWPDKSLLPRKPAPDPLPPADCTCGSQWVAEIAQMMMAGLHDTPAATSATFHTADAFHDVSDVRPFHLPHVFHPPPGQACPKGGDGVCLINSTTVTMPIYDAKDSLDLGLYPISASEFRTKLKSRQAMRQKAGLTGALVDYETIDRNNTRACAEINAAAYAWALSHAHPAALKRFKRIGLPMTFGDDIWSGIGVTGPKWIHDPLRMSVAPDGKSTLVAAPIFTTPNKNLGDESYLVTVGYHCAPLPPPPTHPPKLTDDAAHVGMQIASCSRRRARWSTLPSTGCAAPGSKVGRTDILGPCRRASVPRSGHLSVSRLRRG